jgi:hypothetical protein
MGDRGNILVKENKEDNGVWLYTHWGRSYLGITLRDALRRGVSSWRDCQYLTRIIFCEIIGNSDDLRGELGYGISSRIWDGDKTFEVIVDEQKIIDHRGNEYTFDEFISPGDIEEEVA